ncbi:hypothetical protein LUZ60_011680 [Juncus effusus]|nr:hypothetical protein LUZ60_011680 [Juncus effusus]
MTSGNLLEIQPSQLEFPFEVKKQSTCSMQLTNKTDQYVAFKVKTTNPKQYCVRPNIGVVQPLSTCDVTVTMQAQKEAPTEMQCKDKFLIQSIVTQNGTTSKDVTADLFTKEAGKVIDESKLRVIYVPTNHPSPVHEEPDEGSPTENGSHMFDSVSRSFEETAKDSSRAIIVKLNEEKKYALEQNQKLRQELELLRKERSKRNSGFSLKFLLIVGLIGAIAGFIIKKT